MIKQSWIDYFFKMTNVIASKSKDPSTKVGAVIINSRHTVVATGYNGFPMGVADDYETHKDIYDDKDQKYLRTIHAELNCILSAASEGHSLNGCVMFVTHQPCIECSKACINAGIKAIYYNHTPGNGAWRQHLPLAKEMLMDAKVSLYEYNTYDRANIPCAKVWEYYMQVPYMLTIYEDSCAVDIQNPSGSANGEFYKDACVDMVQAAREFAKYEIDHFGEN